MARYIELDKLVAEIERRRKYNQERSYLDRSPSMAGKATEDKDILSFINTLEVKELDLDKIVKHFYELELALKAKQC